MFSLGRSERTYRDSELIRFGQDRASVGLEFTANERENRAEIDILNGKRKSITYNDIPMKKSSELMGKFRVVYFDPDYLEIVKGGPKIRRNNLDVFISQLRPNYFSCLSGLKKIIESKNALLKGQAPNMTMLEILNQKLVENASYVIKYRTEYVEKLQNVSREIQLDISGGKEELKIVYSSCVGDSSELDIDTIKEKLKERLESGLKREMENREASIGPHREDISYMISGRDVRVFGSQGQKKTTALVQKISEAELINQETGEYPVLLLDDIMSELDNNRQDYILNQLDKMQIFITCTDPSRFEKLENVLFLRVENGTITVESD
uniref:DNA replication and repair protein RecF n=1 Tax=uncultured Bacillota bacterium TaxID=344338 RepID=A0A650ENM5_9FIRM|nr:DNA replication and repair protein RecF [uncultured Firmicutes bacterium]